MEQDFGGELCSTGLRSDIVLFFVLRATCAICLKPRKTLGKTVVFAHQELLRTASARACESMTKLGKIVRWSFQKPPRSVLDPSKIDRGALQMKKKRTRNGTNAARTQNAAWKRPRAKNSANIAPKHRQIGSPAGRAGLPLKHVRKALMLDLKRIVLTRLGTDSGAAN